jgi:hypothetical protein
VSRVTSKPSVGSVFKCFLSGFDISSEDGE